MTPQREFRRTLQKGFRRTGNPDLVNDLFRYTPNYIYCYTLGIVQDTALTKWNHISMGIYLTHYHNGNCRLTDRRAAEHYLSEPFIRKFQDKVNWSEISALQKLRESFVREFQDKVIWKYIVRYQNLSISFINERM